MKAFGLLGLLLTLMIVVWILMQGVETFQSDTMGEEGTMGGYIDSAKDAADSMSR